MAADFFSSPILNSPYMSSARHWELDADGQPTNQILDTRRRSDLITPVPMPKKRRQGRGQTQMVFDTAGAPSTEEQEYNPTPIINEVRTYVESWRNLPNPDQWLVSAETVRLLEHWRHHQFQGVRPFFCQVEAVETAIWLAEVAPKMGSRTAKFWTHLKGANEQSNPELMRLALKLATGAGKTTVMAMLIAWQTVNAVRHPNSKSFSRGFLIVAPGITIKDRLRVLQPNDPESYYKHRELMPPDMLADIDRAKIVITNYHAFKLRERIDIAKGTRTALEGWREEKLQTLETDGQMLQRVMPELMGMKNVVVLNDEAHHCYRERVKDAVGETEDDLKGEERDEARENNEAARMWISGLETIKRKLGLSLVYDLSATPFFLRGSGYAEGTLFPWTMSDFSLMDAIECGIVKLPRVPVADNIPGGDTPKFRNLWDELKKGPRQLPKKGRLTSGKSLDPLELPPLLLTALDALYGHYQKTFDLWEKAGIGVPPVFIVVCNNTSTSELVFKYVSGFQRKNDNGTSTLENGRLELFRNYDEYGNRIPRPNTILIDSAQLESGEALDKDFREMASDEIDRFRREMVERTGDIRAGDAIDDTTLLREVMNTVGKKGKLGEQIRCVVSVSMLTEGWDANSVTHVLGVRAFGTQLLCEQVVGRALRRQSYDLNEEGLFNVEYADVLGIPFDFAAKPVVSPPSNPRETVRVQAVKPERDRLEIVFPRVEGYRVELPEERLEANFGPDSVLELTPRKEQPGATIDLFADFNGLTDKEAATEFYQHDQHWSNRMILGDSLSVMASLAEREHLRGQVQCIYFDPPYGIKFNSNFQWSTTSRDVKDGAKDHITREPEQVRAFRDTWRDGIHSYLTYLRDRLTVARDLLHESGSIFVQIGDENHNLISSLLDEVFGTENRITMIPFVTTGGQSASDLGNVFNFLIWYSRNKLKLKYRQLYSDKELREGGGWAHSRAELPDKSRKNMGVLEVRRRLEVGEGIRPYSLDGISSQGSTATGSSSFTFEGRKFHCGHNAHWKTSVTGMKRLALANRIESSTNSIRYVRFLDDFPIQPITNLWADTNRPGYIDAKTYVVQTSAKVIERCILMATDPGDLVLDPTCGSGTTAYVAEQWGRRWITLDTSRVSLALARSRIMGARYPFYLLADSPEGQRREGEVTRIPPKTTPTRSDIRHGFVYERVPHITLKSIANNAEIDVIWEKYQEILEPLRAKLNAALSKAWEEWEIPRKGLSTWPAPALALHATWWDGRIGRQKEIDASIAAKAEFEYLYDRPYPDTSKVRVAGPFTVESLSPHRTLAVDANDELIDMLEASEGKRKASQGDGGVHDFAEMILENLKHAGVQQAHKDDRMTFTSLTGWPGDFICAEGHFFEGDKERRAGIFIGPEFGTVSRPDLVAAAREAGDAGFDVLIACAFNYDAHSAEFAKLGRVPVLKARMNPDLHMAKDLKSTGAGNLFVVFGEPDIKIISEGEDVRVKIEGVDVFKPQTGEIVSEGPDGIALWMIDTDYNEESFFVRHAYFLGANDPYKALKTTLKSEIDLEAWESLNSDISRPFPKPTSGRIAVKVINHLGDEVMKVFEVK